MSNKVEEQAGDARPLLSIVVPIYNVATYLDECLESISLQAVDNFEVIMVDDGSTDGSGDIASQWATKDERFRLITQENQGLGQARNSGIPYVKGRYMAFLDSDDCVPADAYQKMMESLEKSDSDFATGNVHRFDSSGKAWQAPLYRWMAKAEQKTTHVTQNHDLLRDHLAHNKVWRTSFWKASKLEFPVGVLYEDVPTTIPGHTLARSVDIVPVVAVLWRVRDQGDSSITQNRAHDAKHLTDRVEAVLTASRFIGSHVGQTLKDEYDVLVLGRDLRWYVDLYHEVDEHYQHQISIDIGRFLAQVSPSAIQRTPVAMRIAYGLLTQGERAGFEQYVALRTADKVEDLATVARNGRAILTVPVEAGDTLPENIRDITDELKVASRVSWLAVEEGHFIVEGWAYIPRIDTSGDQEIAVSLDNDSGSIPADLEYRRDDEAAADVGAVAEAAGRIAFTAKVPLKRLRGSLIERLRRRVGMRSWLVRVKVSTAGLSLSAPLSKPTTGAAERPLMVKLGDGNWFRACWTRDGLSCRAKREGMLLKSVRGDSAGLEFLLEVEDSLGTGAQLRLRNKVGAYSVPIKVDPDNGRRAVARVRPSKLPGWDAGGDEQAWNLFFRSSRLRTWQRLLEPSGSIGGVVNAENREFTTRRTRAAAVDLVRGEVGPEVVRVEWSEEATLRVGLRKLAGFSPDAVRLSAARHEEYFDFPVKEHKGEYLAELPLGQLPKFGESVPLRSGTWDIAVCQSGSVLPGRSSDRLIDELPCTKDYRNRRYMVSDRRLNTLSVIIDTDLDNSERGVANQQWLRTSVYPSAKTGLQEVVLLESYYGKQFSDSPREVFSELLHRKFPAEYVVAVRDQQFNVPHGATPVAYRSRDYYKLLAQAKYIVANTHLPNCFRRTDGQTVLQTWHGVGTKKIGLDMDAVKFANKSYTENILNGESDNWDYLVSPNPFTSPILKRAFKFRGDLLETGSPRNDIFHREERHGLAEEVKRRLGIDSDRKIIMYAPTWRDDRHDGPGRYRLDLRFDLHEAARRLGSDYILMFRKHSNIIDRLPDGEGAVIDVSDYPEVQELLLVADVLISDYSTLMCDFANTGRPMLFYTYDLANYRDSLRGFYFDFEKMVPGPLIMEEGDLVPAILGADSIRAEYDSRYRVFFEQFCPWDDGSSTKRVVNAVFGEGR